MAAITELSPSQRSAIRHDERGREESRLPAYPTEDPFFYGYRLQLAQNERGESYHTYIPIQQNDFLDPQLGDHFVQGTCHERDVDVGKSVIRRVQAAERDTAVFSDLKIDWGIEGLSNPAPDIAVIPHVQDQERPRTVFDVQAESTRPRGVIEFVSPNYVNQDYEDKVEIYEQAGVEEYIIIDSGLRPWRDTLHYSVRGYHLVGERYVPIQPDERGRIYSQVNRVWFAVRTDPPGFDIFDGVTGELLLPTEEELQRERNIRIQAQDRAEVAEEVAEQERLARSQAEEVARQERLARSQAEERTDQERLARSQAEEMAEQERLARRQAEEVAQQERLRAEQEKLARSAAEAQVEQLKAQLRALGIQVE